MQPRPGVLKFDIMPVSNSTKCDATKPGVLKFDIMPISNSAKCDATKTWGTQIWHHAHKQLC